MESLIKNGEEWMSPLLKYRDLLAFTTDPVNKDTYRNYKRRTGKVSYQYAKDGEDRSAERKHVLCPYWLKYRQQWLKDLLEIERDLNARGHRITLITESELHAIRQEWLKDPNEPDWYDTLPVSTVRCTSGIWIGSLTTNHVLTPAMPICWCR